MGEESELHPIIDLYNQIFQIGKDFGIPEFKENPFQEKKFDINQTIRKPKQPKKELILDDEFFNNNMGKSKNLLMNDEEPLNYTSPKDSPIISPGESPITSPKISPRKRVMKPKILVSIPQLFLKLTLFRNLIMKKNINTFFGILLKVVSFIILKQKMDFLFMI